MLLDINITDEDIRYSERILLPEGEAFDEERRTYIKNFRTIDLQAVPGSGKTTTILAKLLILERKLPLYNGSGVLVISHTNASIDEIKNRIQKYCPKLFTYPNFVGTIQSFVDEFLAIPFYTLSYKKKPTRIDNEIYDEISLKHFRRIPHFSTLKTWLENKGDPESLFMKLRFDTDWNLLSGLNGKIILKSENQTKTYIELKNIKLNILKLGFLHFDDAYFLAECYMKKFPNIITLLQNRFSFVFIDEMQDMDKHQYNLLEQVFFDEGKSTSVLQRIGDKNQAIYNSVKAIDHWNDRAEVLRLSGSKRLSEPIAKVVKHFALYKDNNFEGLNNCLIKPHILHFEDDSINNCIFRTNDTTLPEQTIPVKSI